jgi:N-alpha-acetyltransferase 40
VKKSADASPAQPTITRYPVLDRSNALSAEEFVTKHVPVEALSFSAKDGAKYDITLRKSSDLTASEFDECFDLIEQASGEDYRASTNGWKPGLKKSEMKEEDMRYLLVRRRYEEPKDETGGLGDSEHVEKTNDNKIVAFLSFMLTPEEDEPVVYVYEIQLSESTRGAGLGKHLMALQDKIAKSVGLEKIMLTVFTRNAHAEKFYRRLGYAEDEISPVNKKLRGGRIRKPEYYIFSKYVG